MQGLRIKHAFLQPQLRLFQPRFRIVSGQIASPAGEILLPVAENVHQLQPHSVMDSPPQKHLFRLGAERAAKDKEAQPGPELAHASGHHVGVMFQLFRTSDGGMLRKIFQVPRLSLHNRGQNVPHQHLLPRRQGFQQGQTFGKARQKFPLPPVLLHGRQHAQPAETGCGRLVRGIPRHSRAHHLQQSQPFLQIHVHRIRHRIRGARQQIAHGHAGPHLTGQKAHAQVKGPGNGG